jgi:hypothetical protein
MNQTAEYVARITELEARCQNLELDYQGLQKAALRLDERAEETRTSALRAFQDAARDILSNFKAENIAPGREIAILSEKTAQRLQAAACEEDIHCCFGMASAGIKWLASEGIKRARQGQPIALLEAPRTKKDLGAQTIITILIEQAEEGRKYLSMTSTKVRDVLAGRFGGGKVARKIGIEVMHRAAKLCPSLQVRPVPGDRRGTLQIIVEGEELKDAEVSCPQYRYHSDQSEKGKKANYPSMIEIIMKSPSIDGMRNYNRNAEKSLSRNYKKDLGWNPSKIVSL